MKSYIPWMVALALSAGLTTVDAAPIRTIQVDLKSTTGSIPASLEARMNASIQGAATVLLEGKEEVDVQSSLAVYEKAMSDVVDRILYGYTVQELDIHASEATSIQIRLQPYGHVIRHVTTKVNYGNLSPYGKSLVEKDLGNLQNRVEQVLLGAPLDSIDWVAPVTQKSIRSELEYRLPEFTPQVDIQEGEETKATVYLVPHGASIRHTEVVIQSNTLPSSLFFATKRYYETILQQVEGLPVSFVRRHIPMLEEQFHRELQESRAVKQFGILMVPRLEVSDHTRLVIQVDSSRYILRGEGYLDMGRQRDSVGLRLFTGLHRGRQDIYLETEFLPNRLSWKFKPSYAYRMTNDTQVGYQYIAPDREHLFFVKQKIKDKWHLRYERMLREEKNEFAIGYDVHSYLRLEYVWAERDRWLRLIGRI